MSEPRFKRITILLPSGTEVHIEPTKVYPNSEYVGYRVRQGDKFLNFEGQMVEFTGDNQQVEGWNDEPEFALHKQIIVCHSPSDALERALDPFRLVRKLISRWELAKDEAETYEAGNKRTEERDTWARKILVTAPMRLTELNKLKETGLK